jgi:hypothetical protein
MGYQIDLENVLLTGIAIGAIVTGGGMLAIISSIPPTYRIIGMQKTEEGINFIIDDAKSDKRYVLTDKFADGLIIPSEQYGIDDEAGLLSSFDSASVTKGINNPDGLMAVGAPTPSEMKSLWGFVMGDGYKRLQAMQAGILSGNSYVPVNTSILKMDF